MIGRFVDSVLDRGIVTAARCVKFGFTAGDLLLGGRRMQREATRLLTMGGSERLNAAEERDETVCIGCMESNPADDHDCPSIKEFYGDAYVPDPLWAAENRRQEAEAALLLNCGYCGREMRTGIAIPAPSGDYFCSVLCQQDYAYDTHDAASNPVGVGVPQPNTGGAQDFTPGPEDYLRATAKAVGVDADMVVDDWKRRTKDFRSRAHSPEPVVAESPEVTASATSATSGHPTSFFADRTPAGPLVPLDKVTRVVVIRTDRSLRVEGYTQESCSSWRYSLQDDGRTLKLFPTKTSDSPGEQPVGVGEAGPDSDGSLGRCSCPCINCSNQAHWMRHGEGAFLDLLRALAGELAEDGD